MRFRSFLIGLVFGGVFLWLALRSVELSRVAEVLRDVRPWTIFPFAAALVGFYWLKAIRWRMLIHTAESIRTGQLIDPMMIGFATNNLLPFRAGEVIRVVFAGRALGLPKAYVLATLVVERVFDLLAVAILVACGLIFFAAGGLPIGSTGGLYIGTVLAVGLCLVVLAIAPRLKSLSGERVSRLLPGKLGAVAVPHLNRFLSGLEPILERGKLALVIVNSLVQWVLLAACIYFSTVALELELSFPVATVVLGIIVLAISLPSSPGYVGTIEYSFVFGLSLFDVGADLALATAIFYHALSFLLVTFAGFISWVRLRNLLD